MNGYYFLSENQILALINQTRSSKDPVVKDTIDELDYQLNQAKKDNASFRLAAQNKLSKIDAKAYNNEELLIDEDALVSSSKTGAYVQCWLWVDAETKPKRSKRAKA